MSSCIVGSLYTSKLLDKLYGILKVNLRFLEHSPVWSLVTLRQTQERGEKGWRFHRDRLSQGGYPITLVNCQTSEQSLIEENWNGTIFGLLFGCFVVQLFYAEIRENQTTSSQLTGES